MGRKQWGLGVVRKAIVIREKRRYNQLLMESGKYRLQMHLHGNVCHCH